MTTVIKELSKNRAGGSQRPTLFAQIVFLLNTKPDYFLNLYTKPHPASNIYFSMDPCYCES